MIKKKKEVQRFDLDPLFIWENIDKYLDKYIAINFQHYYYAKNDIKQDVFIKVMRYRTFNKDKAKISTYLTTVCRNTILDMDRKKKNRIKQGFVYIDKYDVKFDVEDEQLPIDEILDEDDLKTHMHVLINNTLTRVEKYIMEHKFLLNETDKQIMNYLNIKKTVYKRYLLKLTTKLKDVFEDSEVVINYCIDNNIEFDPVD